MWGAHLCPQTRPPARAQNLEVTVRDEINSPPGTPSVTLFSCSPRAGGTHVAVHQTGVILGRDSSRASRLAHPQPCPALPRGPGRTWQ